MMCILISCLRQDLTVTATKEKIRGEGNAGWIERRRESTKLRKLLSTPGIISCFFQIVLSTSNYSHLRLALHSCREQNRRDFMCKYRSKYERKEVMSQSQSSSLHHWLQLCCTRSSATNIIAKIPEASHLSEPTSLKTR